MMILLMTSEITILIRKTNVHVGVYLYWILIPHWRGRIAIIDMHP